MILQALGLTPHQINQLNNTSPHRRVVSSPEQHLHSRDSDTFGKLNKSKQNKKKNEKNSDLLHTQISNKIKILMFSFSLSPPCICVSLQMIEYKMENSPKSNETDDETTPPGTPPPPYKIKTKSSASDSKHPMVPKRNYFQQATNTTQSNESSAGQNNPNSHNLSEHDEFMANESIFNTSTSSAASYGASNCSNISAAQANILQRQIISMEDDELVDDQDSISGKKKNQFYLELQFTIPL